MSSSRAIGLLASLGFAAIAGLAALFAERGAQESRWDDQAHGETLGQRIWMARKFPLHETSGNGPFFPDSAAISRSRACSSVLDSLGLTEHAGMFGISYADSVRLTEGPCAFLPAPTPPFELDIAAALRPAAAWALLILVLLVPCVFVATYSHIGWRRLAIMVGASAGLAVLVATVLTKEELVYGLFAALLVSGLLAALVLLVRDGVLWVRIGFSKTT